jgi:hypothetical protein
MVHILFDRLLLEVASSRLAQTNQLDDRRTDYDANCSKGRLPGSLILRLANKPTHPELEKPSLFPPELPCTVFATVVTGHYPSTVSERLRQGRKMVSSLDLHLQWFVWHSQRRPCRRSRPSRGVEAILDAHYLGRDVQLAEAAMLKLEKRTKL